MDSKWIIPNMKEAQRRSKSETAFDYDSFLIPDEAKDLGKNRHYFIRTYGCQANERDTETISGILEMMGYSFTDDMNIADVILFNTCAIRENAESKVFGEIGHIKGLKRNNPDLILGICGCMSQEESVVKKIRETYDQIDLVFGTHNIHRLPQLLLDITIDKARMIEVFSQEGYVIENLPVKRVGTHKAWVNIMYGCDKFCTYCIVPYTRGKERSRKMADILAEVNSLVENGYKEVTLLGQNVNAYGKDLEMVDGFANLLEEVAKTGISRLRFVTSHPWDFSNRMIDVIKAYDNIMPYIHLPVQSGSSRILKLMGRRYTIEEYRDLFNRLRSAIPNCSFTTDIIVGFPDETEEDFEKTLEIVEYCKFDGAFTFIFSARTGTPAAKMVDTTERKIKEERLQTLNERVTFYARMNNEKYVGRIVTVLVDGFSKKNDNVYSGYTETQKLVNFAGTNLKVGDLVEVEITGAKSWTLDGKQV